MHPPIPEALLPSLDALLALITPVQHILVVSHTSPDGDAVGSTLAMGLLLERLGKQVVFYNQDAVPYNFRFLPAASRWTTELTPAQAAQVELVVMLDCASPGRVGEALLPQLPQAHIGVIDHHKSWNDSFAQVYVRDPSAAATGELIYWVARHANIQLDQEIAACIYCCVLTDTGSFRYSCTSTATFQIAGELLATGINSWELSAHIYESQPVERVLLLARALSTLSVSECGRLAMLRLERAMFEDLLTSAPPDERASLADGFINHARGVRGVEVATQLFEMEDGAWRLSFRSRGRVDVSRLAERFGGGGHHNAAGCTMHGEAAAIEAQLASALRELLDAPTAAE